MIFENQHFKSGWLHPGDIINRSDKPYIVYQTAYTEHDGNIVSEICEVDLGSLEVRDKSFNLIYNEAFQFELIGKGYMNPSTKQYQHHKLDDCESYGFPPNYSAVLPRDNPLGPIPYWEAPGGKNLTILHCLEWSLLHLKNEQSKLPCDENKETIVLLAQAIECQNQRRRLREEQGVLGTNQPHKSD